MIKNRFILAFTAIVGVLFLSLFSIRQSSDTNEKNTAKVYECFEVEGDLQSLKEHFSKLNNVVDKFVVLETLEDLEGNPKELFYEHNKAEFSQYHEKIIYLVTSRFSKNYADDCKEINLNNQYLKALDQCRDEDIILFSNTNLVVNLNDLYQGIVRLERYPEEVLKVKAKGLKHGSSNLDVKLATFASLKKISVDDVEKSSWLKAQNWSWKSFFSPFNY